MSRFNVGATDSPEYGVWFSIDHQMFHLRIDHDPDEMPVRERNEWYAAQLRIALARLAGGGR